MSKLEKLIQQYCPDGVEWIKIKDIAQVGTGSSNGNEADEDGKYPFFVRSQIVKSKNDFEYDEEAIIIPGEGGIGDIFHYINGKYALHQRVYRIHFTTQQINVKFAFYYMKSAFKRFIMTKAVSATVTSIRKPMIKDFEIPVPPLPVQEEIVRVLDTFTELQAELQAELQKRKQQYNYYLDNLLNFKNINRGGQEIKWMKMSEVASFTYGYTSKAQDSGNVRYIRITDITDKGQLNPKNGKYISLADDVRPYLLQKGDLIMARTGATYGKTLYYNEDYPSAYASFLIKITLNQSVDSKYYWHFTRSSIYWEQANRLVGGGAQPQFNTGAISQVKIPLPSIEEQQRIADILDRFDTLTNDLTSGLPAEMEKRRQQYEFYRDKLLTFKRKEA